MAFSSSLLELKIAKAVVKDLFVLTLAVHTMVGLLVFVKAAETRWSGGSRPLAATLDTIRRRPCEAALLETESLGRSSLGPCTAVDVADPVADGRSGTDKVGSEAICWGGTELVVGSCSASI